MSSDPLVEHTGTICFTEGSVFGDPCAKFDQLGRVEAATKSEPQVVLVKGLSQFPDNRAECVIRASDGALPHNSRIRRQRSGIIFRHSSIHLERENTEIYPVRQSRSRSFRVPGSNNEVIPKLRKDQRV